MRCGYCFYFDEIGKREVPLRGVMSRETLENVVAKSLDFADGQCAFGFQGGEPTLAGLDFFRRLIELVEKYDRKDLRISYALQTNGLALDDDWAAFLAANDFLVGLSLDGDKDIHDLHRLDAGGKSTFNRVVKNAHLLARHGVRYNLLTVVTAATARHIRRIYRYFMKNGFVHQQYIPCLDPLGEERGRHRHSLTPEAYGSFLTRLFDAWLADVEAERFVYIRYFENLAGLLLGHPPESCGMAGRCLNQHVVEADGSVYPCDFYMLDEYRLGNLNDDSFADLHKGEKAAGFIAASLKVEEECRSCEWRAICRGGCRRDRQGPNPGDIGKNYYCGALQKFYAHAIPRLVRLLRSRSRPAPLPAPGGARRG